MKVGQLALCLLLALTPLPALAETPVPAQADWVAARKFATTSDGLTLSYVEAGNPNGPPLVLLHGYSDNSRSWSLLAPLLVDRRLIMLDLRGHGGSAAPACCYGPDSLARSQPSPSPPGILTGSTIWCWSPPRLPCPPPPLNGSGPMCRACPTPSTRKASSCWTGTGSPTRSRPISSTASAVKVPPPRVRPG
ncbi:MAG: alpha/beta fold hydrolase [Rhodobacter sp.]|nr:alpha/beta fold hydrolase [Rhodobacter sp.]